MSEFMNEIVGRVGRTTQSLQAAVAAEDDYLVSVLYGELESLERVAAEHEVEIPGLKESLDRHGQAVEIILPRDEAQRIA